MYIYTHEYINAYSVMNNWNKYKKEFFLSLCLTYQLNIYSYINTIIVFCYQSRIVSKILSNSQYLQNKRRVICQTTTIYFKLNTSLYWVIVAVVFSFLIFIYATDLLIKYKAKTANQFSCINKIVGFVAYNVVFYIVLHKM